MIFYENLEHFGIKIANLINFWETMNSETYVKIDYEEGNLWRIRYLLSMMRN
jgi:hypothetical protein